MARERLWAPWRLRYVKHASRSEEECIFCAKPRGQDDAETLIVHRGEHCFVMLNLFPYTNGHLMVSPFSHIGRYQDLPPRTLGEMHSLAQHAMDIVEGVYSPEGFNIGINQGAAAGAGVPGHIHLHLVPRWGGDTNFMPVIGDVRVMPQSLEESYELIRGGFDE